MVFFRTIPLRSKRETATGIGETGIFRLGHRFCERKAEKMAFDSILHLFRPTKYSYGRPRSNAAKPIRPPRDIQERKSEVTEFRRDELVLFIFHPTTSRDPHFPYRTLNLFTQPDPWG